MTEATNRIDEKNSRISRLLNSCSIKGGDSNSNNNSSNNNNNNNQVVGSLLEAVKAFNFYRTMWLNRKQLCMDAVDLLSEGTGKKMKDIMVIWL